MKILVATGLYPPEIGGPATYSKLLADNFPSRGIKVEVLPFRDVRKFPRVLRHLLYFTKALYRGASCDAVFAQDPVSVGLPAFVAAKILRKRFLLRVGGDYAWEQAVQRMGVADMLDVFSRSSRYSFSVRVLKNIQRFVARGAETVVVPSMYLKRIVMNWGVSEERITVIYNAFTPSAHPLVRDEARRKLGLKGTVIMSAGRLVPWKGFGTLVELFPRLRRDIPDLMLLIAGDGPEREILREKIKGANAGGCVRLLGSLPHDDLKTYVRGSDVFVLNTAYEGLSHQLLEVMALETPVVTTSAGGNPEIIEDGKSGILVPYDDVKELHRAIVRFARDEAFRSECVESALRKAHEFTVERMVRETAGILV